MDPSPWAWNCSSPFISWLKHRLLSAWKYQPMLVSSIFPFCLFLPFPKPHHGSPDTSKDTPSHLGLALVTLLGSKGVPPAPSHLPMGCTPAPTAHGVPQGDWDMGHPKGLSYSPSTGNLQPKPDSQGGNMPFIVGEKVSEVLTRLPEQRSSAYPAANFLSNLTQENNNPGYGTWWVCF